MQTKLGMKISHGRVQLTVKEIPDLDEAKRMWMEGKSAQYILEEAKRKNKKKKQ